MRVYYLILLEDIKSQKLIKYKTLIDENFNGSHYVASFI